MLLTGLIFNKGVYDLLEVESFFLIKTELFQLDLCLKLFDVLSITMLKEVEIVHNKVTKSSEYGCNIFAFGLRLWPKPLKPHF